MTLLTARVNSLKAENAKLKKKPAVPVVTAVLHKSQEVTIEDDENSEKSESSVRITSSKRQVRSSANRAKKPVVSAEPLKEINSAAQQQQEALFNHDGSPRASRLL